MRVFPLAPMSPFIRALTLFFLALPVAFFLATVLLAAPPALLATGALLAALYAAVWLWWRPSHFEVGEGRLSLVFPARRLDIPLADVAGCRTLSSEGCRHELGWGLRVGVGGLWGGFGRLWTSRRGWLDFFVSRTDRFVLVERRAGRPLLVTPADAAGLAAALQPAGGGPGRVAG